MVQFSHPYMTTGKTMALTIWIFMNKVMFLVSTLSIFVIAILPKSKCLLIMWLQLTPALILESKTWNLTVSFYLYEVIGLDGMMLVFWIPSLKPASSFSSFTFTKSLFSLSSLSVIKVVSFAWLRLTIFLNYDNLDITASLWFIQPSISLNIICIYIK